MNRLAAALALVLVLSAPAAAGPPCGLGGSLRPAGYQQITISTTATALTVPTNAIYAVVVIGTNTIRVRDDGTSPTSSVGTPYGATTYPQTLTICGSASLSQTRMIRISSDAEVNVSYYTP